MTIRKKNFPKKELKLNTWNEPSSTVCEGDCDSDNQCETGLKCFHDALKYNKDIPGCIQSEAFAESDGSNPYADFCYEVPTLLQVEWDGSYGDENTFVGKGGSIVDNTGKIQLFGNVWKAYKLSTPYIVNGNTRVSFKFEMTQEAEGHAICFEDDKVSDTFGGFHKRCIMVSI